MAERLLSRFLAHEKIEFDHAIEFDMSLLNQAARGEHLAWALSSAIASIMSRRGRRDGLRPIDRQRDRLLVAITSAYLTADSALPAIVICWAQQRGEAPAADRLDFPRRMGQPASSTAHMIRCATAFRRASTTDGLVLY
jgi:hypothetical protein